MIFKPLMRAWVKDWPDQSKVAELPNKIPGTWADQSLPPPGWTGDDGWDVAIGTFLENAGVTPTGEGHSFAELLAGASGKVEVLNLPDNPNTHHSTESIMRAKKAPPQEGDPPKASAASGTTTTTTTVTTTSAAGTTTTTTTTTTTNM